MLKLKLDFLAKDEKNCRGVREVDFKVNHGFLVFYPSEVARDQRIIAIIMQCGHNAVLTKLLHSRNKNSVETHKVPCCIIKF